MCSSVHKPLRDHPLHFMNILQSLAAHGEVISITHNEGHPPTRGLDGFHEPFLHHLVQIDVTEQWRYHTALGCAFFRLTHVPFLPHDRLQPFGHQTGNHSILHTTAQELLHLSMIDSVEKFAQIHLKNPMHFLRYALFSQAFQRLML